MTVRPEDATKDNVTSCKWPPQTIKYTFRDAILYALGIGLSTQDENGLRYLYENAKDFQVFPLYGVMLTIPDVVQMLSLPGLKINPSGVLPLGLYFEQHRALPAQNDVTKEFEVVDVLDRETTGSQYLYRVSVKDSKGPLFTTEGSLSISDVGKFGDPIETDKSMGTTKVKPERPPDAIIEYKIGLNQPAIFRLSGDYNPIHIDPAVGKKANFQRNLVHGTCTMGIAAQLILKKYGNADSRRLGAMMVRFSNVAYPGDTLELLTWKEDNLIQFEAKIKERGELVLTGGYVKMLEKPLE